jgi:uncharacterized protein (TIGR02466 family)
MYSIERLDHLFVTPIIAAKLHAVDNDALYNFCKKQEEIDKDPKYYSNRNGWQSEHIHNCDEVLEIKNNIINLLGDNSLDFKQMWFNINYPGSYNVLHQHGPFKWSGNYYIKTPENCGNIVLRDPRPGFLYNTHWNKGPVCYKQIKVEERLLLIFPSYLDHFVEQNKSSDERISLAFDLS